MARGACFIKKLHNEFISYIIQEGTKLYIETVTFVQNGHDRTSRHSTHWLFLYSVSPSYIPTIGYIV